MFPSGKENHYSADQKQKRDSGEEKSGADRAQHQRHQREYQDGQAPPRRLDRKRRQLFAALPDQEQGKYRNKKSVSVIWILPPLLRQAHQQRTIHPGSQENQNATLPVRNCAPVEPKLCEASHLSLSPRLARHEITPRPALTTAATRCRVREQPPEACARSRRQEFPPTAERKAG